MEKILNKMGIYDIIGVWLSGVIILFLTAIITNELFNWSVLKYCYFANAIFTVAGGYFVGMVFQEMGNFLQRNLFNRNSCIIKSILGEANEENEVTVKKKDKDSVLNRNISLTKPEREFVLAYPEFKGDKSDPEYIYNYGKYYVVSKADASGMDRNQVTAAISRSLAVYFAFLILFIAISMLCITDKIVAKCIVTAVSVFLSILFFYRSYRFVKIRYVQYFRAFYFDQNL